MSGIHVVRALVRHTLTHLLNTQAHLLDIFAVSPQTYWIRQPKLQLDPRRARGPNRSVETTDDFLSQALSQHYAWYRK